MSGDFRIGLQPGFGGLMQDLGRHALGDVIKKPETPVVQQPSPAAASESGMSSFLPAVITLSSPLPLHDSATDRRLLTLAEFQQAFVDFDEPAEARHPAGARKTQEVGRSKVAKATTEASTEKPAPQRHAAPSGLELQPFRPGSKPLPGQSPAAPSRQTMASTVHVASQGGSNAAGPASGQPTLFIFVIMITAVMLGWVATRLL